MRKFALINAEQCMSSQLWRGDRQASQLSEFGRSWYPLHRAVTMARREAIASGLLARCELGERVMRLRSAVECLFLVSSLYAAGIVAAADHHVSFVESWIGLTRGAVDGVLFFRPEPGADVAPILIIYRHVLVVSLLLTVSWAWITLRWRSLWAAEIVEAYRRAHNDRSPSQPYLRNVHGISALAASGVIYLLFLLQN